MKKSSSREHLEEITNVDKACYIILSCDAPAPDGTMEVKMTYEGDPTLAAYLLGSACERIEEQLEADPELGLHQFGCAE